MECFAFVHSCFTHGKFYLSTDWLWWLSWVAKLLSKCRFRQFSPGMRTLTNQMCWSVSLKSWLKFYWPLFLWNKSAWHLSSISWQYQNTPNKRNLNITYCVFTAQNSLLPLNYHEQKMRISIGISTVLRFIIALCLINTKPTTDISINVKYNSQTDSILNFSHDILVESTSSMQ